MTEEFSDALDAHLTRNGFIWGPEPEIYDALAGFYTYGPMGKLLKNKLEQTMGRVFRQEKFYEVEAPIIMPADVWGASGHLETFVDPMILCSQCEGSFRADKLLEERTDIETADGFSDAELLEALDEHGITCPSCGGAFEEEVHDYNLMMETSVAGREAYSRPETATTTYLPFKRYWRFFRKKLPIKVFQIGKAFRNEISPRQHVLRGREFTQAEGQVFVTEDMKHDWDGYDAVADSEVRLWSAAGQDAGDEPVTMTLAEAVESGEVSSEAYAWCLHLAWKLFRSVGIPADRMRYREHTAEERAHYAQDAWDLEVRLDSFGWTECCGVHDRGSYDLAQHTTHSPEDLSFKDNDGNEVLPHILEIAFGTDRPTFALLDIFFDAEDQRLNLPRHVAPVDVAVFPLMGKDGMPDLAEEVYRQLHERRFDVEYDDSGSIGKRYARQDAKGTPLCVTIDYDTMEEDTVTLRERDTTDQIRLPLEELAGAVREYLYGGAELSELGDPVE